MSDWINKTKVSEEGKWLAEDESFILQENGAHILLEEETSEFTNLVKH